MNVRVKFLGAAESVTGSKYLLEIDREKILIDCGLFQGIKELRLRNWDKFPVEAASISKVIITHAHIDHSGYLPRLIKEGFKGQIFCTRATEDLMHIMLKDAAKLQEEEALFAYKKGYSKHEKPEPLFTTADAERVFERIESASYHKEIKINNHLSVKFFRAGHILGSSIVELTLYGQTQTKKIVFSGDLGRYEDPVMHAPEAMEETDILFVESTYGNRINPATEVENDLAKIINEAIERNGVIIIPAFAVGRTQSLLYYFHQLMEDKIIPTLPIYIDSPMAISVTDLYERHASEHKIKVEHRHGKLYSIFDDPQIHFCHTSESSKSLNSISQPCIIISASGMATGGRILHHLYHRLRKENDIVLFAGYQAEGSRGRRILDGEPTVKIFGEEVPVKCQVRVVNGLSAHADQQELLQWVGNFKKVPKMTFIVHGEKQSATVFSELLQKKGWNPIIPQYLESFQLFGGI